MEGVNLLFYVSQSTREVITASGVRRHALGGLFQKIVTNRSSVAGGGGGLTPATLGEVLRQMTRHGASNMSKLFMAGQNAIASASAWPVGTVQTSPRNTEWGYNIRTCITPYGDIDFVQDPVLTKEYGLQDKLVGLDLEKVRQTYLRSMGMQLYQKVANLSGIHRIVDAITLTAGLQLHNEELFCLLEDI
jgi:hypothetical protein